MFVHVYFFLFHGSVSCAKMTAQCCIAQCHGPQRGTGLELRSTSYLYVLPILAGSVADIHYPARERDLQPAYLQLRVASQLQLQHPSHCLSLRCLVCFPHASKGSISCRLVGDTDTSQVSVLLSLFLFLWGFSCCGRKASFGGMAALCFRKPRLPSSPGVMTALVPSSFGTGTDFFIRATDSTATPPLVSNSETFSIEGLFLKYSHNSFSWVVLTSCGKKCPRYD